MQNSLPFQRVFLSADYRTKTGWQNNRPAQADAPGAFWLTGSQAFKMMELAQESLAGRVAILHMPSLSQHEIYGSGSITPFTVDLSALKASVSLSIWAESMNEFGKGLFLGM